ncbi:AAA family ATPase [Rheinheimera sp. YQF-2]|uniref:AAA family ATPase n=1 Tax=Rheinheimera lutimaris TaxID=2740584 RepID=A0A7Y5ASF0_9GAMM|nr:AAA family ATPase [Rheinheimera lutimaris]NRQ43608.1 AAA family ATPase [Rheinheimera lutimaris]
MALEKVDAKSSIVVHPFSIQMINSDHIRADLPTSSLWYGDCFHLLSAALDEYKDKLEELKQLVKEQGATPGEISEYLKKLPSADWNSANDPIAQSFVKAVAQLFPEQEEKLLFIKFLSDKNWWFKQQKQSSATQGKTLDRSDVYDSCLALACRVVVNNSAKLLNVIKAFKSSPALRTRFSELQKQEETMITATRSATEQVCAENVIYYGAPGVGKSHQIEQKCHDANSFKMVFHPDTQYSDFVGCLKPSMLKDTVSYAFRPGPFTRAIVRAYNEPDTHIYLVIEEINRAAAAAVFGEIFLLLDRDNTGAGKYAVTLSDPDLLQHFNTEAPSAIVNEKLRLPPNLSIYATMNSSDQAVMPLDTAFKRRWRFEYVAIDFSVSPAGEFIIPLSDTSEGIRISWANFAREINEALENSGIPEDRLLGPWFLSANELADEQSSLNALRGKVLLYLWDDVLRHGEQKVLFHSDIKNFGNLVSRLNSHQPIFNQKIEDKLKAKDSTIRLADNESNAELPTDGNAADQFPADDQSL